MSLKQPKISTVEWVLFFGAFCFMAGLALQMTVLPGQSVPVGIVGGGLIFLVCFIIAMRDEG